MRLRPNVAGRQMSKQLTPEEIISNAVGLGRAHVRMAETADALLDRKPFWTVKFLYLAFCGLVNIPKVEGVAFGRIGYDRNELGKLFIEIALDKAASPSEG